MAITLGFDSQYIALGAGQVCHFRDGASHVTVTPVADPAATTTTFGVVTATDGAKLRVGDVVQLVADAATPAYTASELSLAPRIVSLVVSGLNTIVTVDKAFPGGAPGATAGAVRVLYKNLGATDGGIGIEFDVTRAEQRIDQSPFVVAAPVSEISARLVLPLAEQRANNWAIALAVAPPASEAAFSMGGAPDLSREDTFVAIIPGDNGLAQYWVFHRGVSQGTVAMRASKTDKSLTELNLILMPDTDFGSAGLFDMVVAA